MKFNTKNEMLKARTVKAIAQNDITRRIFNESSYTINEQFFVSIIELTIEIDRLRHEVEVLKKPLLKKLKGVDKSSVKNLVDKLEGGLTSNALGNKLHSYVNSFGDFICNICTKDSE